jgi:hypothetical protein
MTVSGRRRGDGRPWRRAAGGRPALARPAMLAVAIRPRLWPSLARQAPTGWWRRWPPSPLPAAGYVRFRTQTMYGDNRPVARGDFIAYLEWCRRMVPRAR